MGRHPRPDAKLRQGQQKEHQPVVEVLTNRERTKVDEGTGEAGQERSGHDRLVVIWGQAAANPNADGGHDHTERCCSEQLLDNARTCPLIRADLVIEMRQQDASAIGELVTLRGYPSDVHDVAQIEGQIGAERRRGRAARHGARSGSWQS